MTIFAKIDKNQLPDSPKTIVRRQFFVNFCKNWHFMTFWKTWNLLNRKQAYWYEENLIQYTKNSKNGHFCKKWQFWKNWKNPISVCDPKNDRFLPKKRNRKDILAVIRDSWLPAVFLLESRFSARSPIWGSYKDPQGGVFGPPSQNDPPDPKSRFLDPRGVPGPRGSGPPKAHGHQAYSMYMHFFTKGSLVLQLHFSCLTRNFTRHEQEITCFTR